MSKLPAPLHQPHWIDNRKSIVLSDMPGTKYEGDNADQKLFSLFRVDKDNILSGQRKCDYLLVSHAEVKALFVELKGRHLLEAIDQILASIDSLKTQLKDHELNGRIVLTRTNSPDLKHPKYVRLKKMIWDTGGELLQRTSVLKEKL